MTNIVFVFGACDSRVFTRHEPGLNQNEEWIFAPKTSSQEWEVLIPTTHLAKRKQKRMASISLRGRRKYTMVFHYSLALSCARPRRFEQFHYTFDNAVSMFALWPFIVRLD